MPPAVASPSPPPSRGTLTVRLRRPLIALAAVLLVASVHECWKRVDASTGIDFYHFWLVPKLVDLTGAEEIYSSEGRIRLGEAGFQAARAEATSVRRYQAAQYFRVLQPTATPWLYTVSRLWSLDDYDSGYLLFQLLSTALFLAGAWVFARAEGLRPAVSMLLLACFLAFFEPMRSDVVVANVNRLLVGLLGAYAGLKLWREKKPDLVDLLAGGVLGLAVAFKPVLVFVPALLLLWYGLNRRHRELGFELLGMGAGAALAVAISSVSFGTPLAWWHWLSGFSGVLTADVTDASLGNVAVARLLEDLLGVPTLAWQVVAALGAGAAVVLAARRRDSDPRADDPAVLSLGLLTYLVSAKLVWLHYLVLVTPLALHLLRATPHSGARRALAALALVLLGVSPSLHFGAQTAGPVRVLSIAAVALLTLAFLRDFLRAPAPAPTNAPASDRIASPI